MLARLEETSDNFGLTVNRDKTKMMIVDRKTGNRPDITSIANCEVVQNYISWGLLSTTLGAAKKK